jgi:SAM-dependent methyltransferase
MRLEDKERIERDFWAQSATERPGADSLENLLNKMTDAPVLLERLRPFERIFAQATSVLELGAGQGWASCLLKRLYPAARFVVTDLSEHAIASLPLWEQVFGVRIDQAGVCRGYQTGLPEESMDVVFCFAAAHHFVAHRRTLREICRVLKPGGQAFYFHEPSCRRLLYRMARRRVNRIRPAVPEDVLVYRKIVQLAGEAGLEVILHPDTSLLKRGPLETFYYFLLRRLPPLQWLLPCTRDFQFKKPVEMPEKIVQEAEDRADPAEIRAQKQLAGIPADLRRRMGARIDALAINPRPERFLPIDFFPPVI